MQQEKISMKKATLLFTETDFFVNLIETKNLDEDGLNYIDK